MALTTRGGLTPAKLKNTANNEEVNFMFNPNEYSLTKSIAWSAKEVKGENLPAQEFTSSGPQTLKLVLYFDTAESGNDVTELSRSLWTMTKIVDSNKNTHSGKGTPPPVEFSWGAIYFKAIITSITEKLTLFTAEGKPIRSQVDISLTEYNDAVQAAFRAAPQGNTNAGGAGNSTQADSGDRIDHVANRTTGDASNYRDVAANAGLDDPMASLKGKTFTG